MSELRDPVLGLSESKLTKLDTGAGEDSFMGPTRLIVESGEMEVPGQGLKIPVRNIEENDVLAIGSSEPAAAV